MARPKTYKSVSEHNEAIRTHFRDRLDKPVVIVGNGPSNVAPFSDSFPKDPVIFRMNWFFLEEEPTYGRRVDGYFWSIDTPALQHELGKRHRSKEYDFGAFFCPMRVLSETGADELAIEGLNPSFDHWSIIAEVPQLARSFMGRPLPTQGFQVIAFALALGFRDLYISGIDLYASKEARYAYQVPKHIQAQLKKKDLTPGYENKHDLGYDMRFFEATLENFPDARLRALSDSPFLQNLPPVVDPTPSVDRDFLPRARLTVRPGPFRPGTLTFNDGKQIGMEELSKDVPELYSTVLEGKKCAYVTLVSGGGFEHGVRILARTLAKHTSVPLVVACTEDADKSAMFAENVICFDIAPIDNPNQLTIDTARFASTYTKLGIWKMTAWDRLIYLDADVIVRANIDELFAIDEFAAAPDLGINLHYERFNSGVFCCQPSLDTFDAMMSLIAKTTSYDGGDQGFLNEFFPQARRLDRNYNVLKRLYTCHPDMFNLDDVKVLHYTGRKPWQTILQGNNPYRQLDELWFAEADPVHLADLSLAAIAPTLENYTPGAILKRTIQRAPSVLRRKVVNRLKKTKRQITSKLG